VDPYLASSSTDVYLMELAFTTLFLITLPVALVTCATIDALLALVSTRALNALQTTHARSPFAMPPLAFVTSRMPQITLPVMTTAHALLMIDVWLVDAKANSSFALVKLPQDANSSFALMNYHPT